MKKHLVIPWPLYHETYQLTHINKICFIVYSLTCFGPFCDHHQDVIQEYKQHMVFTPMQDAFFFNLVLKYMRSS